jgi:hypothetical protein
MEVLPLVAKETVGGVPVVVPATEPLPVPLKLTVSG